MNINIEAPSMIDIFAKFTPKGLTNVQLDTALNIATCISQMRRVPPDDLQIWSESEDSLLEGIADMMITIVQLMTIYRISSESIETRMHNICSDDRWAYLIVDENGNNQLKKSFWFKEIDKDQGDLFFRRDDYSK